MSTRITSSAVGLSAAVVYCVLLSCAVVFASTPVSDVEGSDQSQRDGDRSVQTFLTANGRFDPKAAQAAGYQGPLDIRGYNVRLDPQSMAPVLEAASPRPSVSSPDDIYWSALGSGTDYRVWALALYNGLLIAGGDFVTAGGLSASAIASWDGSAWSPLGSGISGPVYALTVFDNKLIAGGFFTTAGGVSANNIAAWDGSTWSPLTSGIRGLDASVQALTVYDNQLVAGGCFTVAGSTSTSGIAAWNGSSWSAVGSGIEGCAHALTVYNNQLIVGGGITTAGGITARNIAAWDGSSWSALGAGVGGGFYDDHVNALTVYDNKLVAGGGFDSAGSVFVNNLASWDGSVWSPIGSGIYGWIYTFAVSGNKLFAGGSIDTLNHDTVNSIAVWDGSTWSALGSGPMHADVDYAHVLSTAIYDGRLIIGGYFTKAGGKSASYIAAWRLRHGLVTRLADDGANSLRSVILGTNNDPGPDTITFTISGEIALTSALPALIDDSTIILGSSAPGRGNPIILDGSALSDGDGLLIQGSQNQIEGLIIRNFPGNGITVNGGLSIQNRISGNLIYDNGGLGIDLGADGATVNDLDDGDSGPNDLLNYPEFDSLVMESDSSFIVYGRAAGKSVIEFFVAHPVGDPARLTDPSGYGEAYSEAGIDTCDAAGSFIDTIPKTIGQFSAITATTIDTLGNTSEFCQNVTLVPQPLIIVAYSPVNIIVTDPDDLQFGKDSLGSLITGISPADYFETPNDSVVIYHPKLGEYLIEFVTEAGTPSGALYSAIIKLDGTDQVTIAADEIAPMSGTMASFTYVVEEGYHYINADANRDSLINVGDAVFIINYVFKSGPEPYPLEAADANCDHLINVGDAVHIINFIFKSGSPPCYFEP